MYNHTNVHKTHSPVPKCVTLAVGLGEGVGVSTQLLPLKESVEDDGVLRPWMLTHIISTLKR